jgi:hypothetical protein
MTTTIFDLQMAEETPLHKLDVEPVTIHSATAESLRIQPTLVPETGREGAEIQHMGYSGRSMAVFTSGGDSSGNF